MRRYSGRRILGIELWTVLLGSLLESLRNLKGRIWLKVEGDLLLELRDQIDVRVLDVALRNQDSFEAFFVAHCGRELLLVEVVGRPQLELLMLLQRVLVQVKEILVGVMIERIRKDGKGVFALAA